METFTDLYGRGRRPESCVTIAGRELLLDDRQQEVASFDAVGGLVLQEPLSAGEPSRRRPYLPSPGEAEAQPERGAHGADTLSSIEIGVMRPIKSSQAIVVPVRQKGRHRHALEVLGLERHFLIGVRESGKGVCPSTPAIAVTALLKLGANDGAECVRMHAIHGHRVCEVFYLLLAHRLETEGKLLIHLPDDLIRDVHAARLGHLLQPRGDVYPFAIAVFILDDHFAEIDADAHLDAIVRGDGSVALRQAPLQCHGTFDRIRHARELRQETIAHDLEDAPATACDFWFKKFLAYRPEALEGTQFIALHMRGVADNVGCQNSSKLSVHRRSLLDWRHLVTSCNSSTDQAKRALRLGNVRSRSGSQPSMSCANVRRCGIRDLDCFTSHLPSANGRPLIRGGACGTQRLVLLSSSWEPVSSSTSVENRNKRNNRNTRRSIG